MDYRIRFELRMCAVTLIKVVTVGTFTRLIQEYPKLNGIGAIQFDEFHERHLASDVGAALVLDIQGKLRPDLRIV
ncbi:hypothetical protein [Dyella mobilis]|uniref:Uncharacterized protein n=1 Tax=Dyella mobilis TaxID=1849582 RepID=A0ABS2KBR6_9GAMM|nr:hypothetical protein [Dyella mobilis]MBM7128625.1 hypothetical protein [Dyella mobilis]GLQ99470.1 hypothetical protein GCM10007863_38900 [Dyella mobilis]